MSNNNMENNNNIELQYAKYKGIDITKKIFSFWDIFLFTLLFTCSFCFLIGFIMFLIGGIGFYTTPDVSNLANKIGSNNGYWHIMNIYDNNWTKFMDDTKFILDQENPTEYYKFLKSAYLLKDVYNVGFLLWLIPLIIFCVFSLIVVIVYIFWVNGFIDSAGKYIFTKIKNLNEKIDNYKPNKNADNKIE